MKLASALILAANVYAKNYGEISMNIDGSPEALFVVGDNTASDHIKVRGDSITIKGGNDGGFQFATEDHDSDDLFYW